MGLRTNVADLQIPQMKQLKNSFRLGVHQTVQAPVFNIVLFKISYNAIMESQHVGVCVIVLDKNRRVLLGKRLNSFKAGMLGLPGGKLELEEGLEECGTREVMEETSLQGKNLQYVGVVRELQNVYNFIHFVFSCNEFEGTVTTVEPDKCESWEWYSLDALPDNIVQGHRAALDMYVHSAAPSYRDLLL